MWKMRELAMELSKAEDQHVQRPCGRTLGQDFGVTSWVGGTLRRPCLTGREQMKERVEEIRKEPCVVQAGLLLLTRGAVGHSGLTGVFIGSL